MIVLLFITGTSDEHQVLTMFYDCYIYIYNHQMFGFPHRIG